MAKQIVLLSDGTGNSASQLLKTNVWRMHLAVDLTGVEQIACYDDGVGTSTFKPLAILGGAFGWGLKRNVLQLYTYLCRQYEVGDRIYGFGFSRGAFTIRLLVGFVSHAGLVPFESEEELQRNAAAAFRAYRKHCSAKSGTPWLARLGRAIRDGYLAARDRRKQYTPFEKLARREVKEIEFLGLWDTVAAYGMPIDEMAQAIDRHIWPLTFPDTKLTPKVKRACHALAIDDERRSFHPVLWNESDEAPRTDDTIYSERISQVWFAGMHSNVGGGYAEDGLAHVALVWIMDEAIRAGLVLSQAITAPMRRAESTTGKMYDSRAGLGVYYRYQPRNTQAGRLGKPYLGPGGVTMRPKVHDSVLARISMAIGGYAPIALPDEFDVVTSLGKVMPTQVTRGTGETGADKDREAVAMIDDLIWLKRLLYLLLFAITALLVASPWLIEAKQEELGFIFDNPSLRIVEAVLSWPIRFVSEALALVLPGFTSRWLNVLRTHPAAFLAVAAIGVVFWRQSTRLETRIFDASRFRWTAGMNGFVPPRNTATRAARALRTTAWLVATYRWVAGRFLPWVIAMVMLAAVPYGINRIVMNALSAAGQVCAGTPEKDLKSVPPEGTSRTLLTKDPCFATGITLEKGVTYRIEATGPAGLRDGLIDAPETSKGFGIFDASVPYVTRAIMLAAFPMRRHTFENYFVPIARIGALGRDEHALADGPVTITPAQTGELFLFVNDAVLFHPAVVKRFYCNNEGSFAVKVSKVE